MKEYKCDQCEKTFVSNWRLKKHKKIQTAKGSKAANISTTERFALLKILGACLHMYHQSFVDVVKLVGISSVLSDMNVEMMCIL